jgi:hypothetical protein
MVLLKRKEKAKDSIANKKTTGDRKDSAMQDLFFREQRKPDDTIHSKQQISR